MKNTKSGKGINLFKREELAKSSSFWQIPGSGIYSKSTNQGWNKKNNKNKWNNKVKFEVVGPGVDYGLGCGLGVELELVGTFGIASSNWNNLRLVRSVGDGCGVGLFTGKE